MKNIKNTDILIACILILLLGITLLGLSSFGIGNSYDVINQYGEKVKMWGTGIYKHDSYFKAPILIGADATVLFMIVPMLFVAFIRNVRSRTEKTKLFLASIIGCILYYSTSLSFGVTFNVLHLLYIGLFSCSLFTFILLLKNLESNKIRENQTWNLPSKGISIYLVVSGLSLFVAWLPDIISAMVSGNSLSLIEIYTTEITYVLDMGIISPIMFICLYLLKKKDGLGDVLLAIILKACEFVGVMVIMQTVFQKFAGIEIPIPALLTKVGIFVVLGSFSFYFNRTLYKKLYL